MLIGAATLEETVASTPPDITPGRKRKHAFTMTRVGVA